MSAEVDHAKPKRKYERRAQPQFQFRAPVMIKMTLTGSKEPEVIGAFGYSFVNGFLRIALPGEMPGVQQSRFISLSRIADLVIQEMVQIPQYAPQPQAQMAQPQEPREYTPRGGWRSLRHKATPDGGVVSEAINEHGQIETVNAGFIE